jgi:hypothetical protein
MAISRYQNFETETIKRSQIKNAEYNPRYMDEKAKKRLRSALRSSGLVSALTWNKRTGNLVGEHQRLEQLDALEKSQDYDLTVCVVDVDERTEAKLNVQLNNPSMQGDWDTDKLANLWTDFEFDSDELGFSKDDAQFLFDGDDRFTELFDTPEADAEKTGLQQIKEERGAMNAKLKEENDASFYAVVVFADQTERDAFFKAIHVPKEENYITADQVYRLTE